MIRARDILGQNARNLLYIHPHNSKAAIKFANSKLRTKQFLQVRDIPVPKLFGVIRNKQELRNFSWDTLPNQFVLKPNAGFGGEGIIVIGGKKEPGVYLKVNGEEITQEDLENHIRDIMDGRFSLGSVADKALFEQLIVNHPTLDAVAYKGLCDIRILVFNMVPVMAMLRIPTKESGGKANVHLGGVGAGIDMGKGTVTHLTQHNKLVREIPGIGNIRGMKIPYWEEMLLISSRIQQLTGLGYLAVDLALDQQVGPVLLEINARAGLMLQVANLSPLKRRLLRVQGTKVKTPEKGVRMAQDLFGGGLQRSITYVSGKEVLGVEEEIELVVKKGTVPVKARVNLSAEKTYIHEKLFKKILHGYDESTQNKGYLKLRINILGKKITTIVYPLHIEEKGIECILGQRDLKDFLIDPNKYRKSELPTAVTPMEEAKPSAILTKPLENEDKQLTNLASMVKVLKYLKPTNFQEEKEKFLQKKGNYNPRFAYKALEFEPEEMTRQLEKLHFDDSPLGQLLHQKRRRVLEDVELIASIGKDHKRFLEVSDRLYGSVEPHLLEAAKERYRLFDRTRITTKKTLTAKEVLPLVEKELEQLGLEGWRAELSKTVGANMAISLSGVVKVRATGMFDKQGLLGTLRHELQTHAFRAVNGQQQAYTLFGTGTGGYLETDEGLAIYNQELVLTENDEKYFSSAKNYLRIAATQDMSFKDAVAYCMNQGWYSSLEDAFQGVYRMKRGIKHTRKGGALTRDLIYFRGYMRIREFLEAGGRMEDLYIGKIALEDLPLIRKMSGLASPLLLPTIPKQ